MKPPAPHALHVAHAAEDTEETDFQPPKAYQKQLDKKVKWDDIPDHEKPLYTARKGNSGKNTFSMKQ